MDQQSVVIQLPAELYDRIRRAAADRHRPIETVMLESLALLFGDLPANLDAMLETLGTYSDDQLWAVAYQRLTWPEETQLKELVVRGKHHKLAVEEQAELEALLDQVDRYTLLRSRALLLLKQRGHDVESRLKLSA